METVKSFKRTKIKRINIKKNEDVYDLKASKNSNFFANKLLVHNCQEFVNIPYSSCNLGSLNLLKFISIDDENKPYFNNDAYDIAIATAIRFLDTVIDQNKYPIKKIEEITLSIRPIGLGIMGLAHALFKLGIPFNSKEALIFMNNIARYTTLRGMKESVELAKEFQAASNENNSRHGAYPAFDYDVFMAANKRFFTEAEFMGIDINQLQKDIKTYGIRNSSITSIAPTGSISTISETSSGIEPVYALTYARKITNTLSKEKEMMYITDKVFEAYLKANFSEEDQESILFEVSENGGSCQRIKQIPKEMQKIFVTANDITPIEHLNTLQAIATNVSLSVSKTINLPVDASKEQIAEVFQRANELGIIGVTVYRDGSREGVLTTNKSNGTNMIHEVHAPKRPSALPCDVHRVKYNKDTWVVFVSKYNGKPYEVFAGKVDEVSIPKSIGTGEIVKKKSKWYAFEHDGEILIKNICKSFDNKEHDAFSRMISIALRHGTPIYFIVNQLSKSRGDITDFSRVISRTLNQYIDDGTHAGGACPSCGNKLIYIGGCVECAAKCGGLKACG